MHGVASPAPKKKKSLEDCAEAVCAKNVEDLSDREILVRRDVMETKVSNAIANRT